MQLTNNRQIKISIGQNRFSKSWSTQSLRWDDFVDKVSKPVRTTELFEDFIKWSKSRQDDIKDVGGFVGGVFKDNRRKAENVISRDLITLDADNIQPGETNKILSIIDSLGCAYCVYSTRKHCSYKPRLRIIIPLDVEVRAEQYEAIARKLASLIDMQIMDSSTFEASRLMYWPSCSKDSEFVFIYSDKPFVNAKGVLDLYSNWKDYNEWPRLKNEIENINSEVQKQKDPLEKQGVVGAFCKVYDIDSVISKYLMDVYEIGNIKGKYTYLDGSVANGATVYGDGRFLYSFHATDPASRTLCNAFDLVRIHLYNDLDDDVKDKTPATQFPSFKAMCALALEDEQVKLGLAKERYIGATNDFKDGESLDDENWLLKIKYNSSGIPLKTADNILTVLENDPELKNKFIYDRFTGRFLITSRVPWNYAKDFYSTTWTDDDEACIRNYFEKKYNINAPTKIKDSLCELKFKNSIHVVQDYFNSLKWDGVKRLDTLLIDYLGTDDTIYERMTIRKTLIAAVARIMKEKGVKFDTMPILVGPQGIGKSTFLRKLGKEWFSDSITTFEGKDTSILLQKCLIVEIAELAAFGKMETNRLKQSISSESDLFREPYEREAKEHPRHCVFFGTTNDDEFLKDSTGNRRYWPVVVGKTSPVKSVFNDLDNEVDMIWAEAYEGFKSGENLFLEGEAAALALSQQEEHREVNPLEGKIQEFVCSKVPLNWLDLKLSQRLDFYSGFGTEIPDSELVARDRICAIEVWCECLNKDIKYIKKADAREINNTIRNLKIEGVKVEKANTSMRFGKEYGTQRGFYLKY